MTQHPTPAALQRHASAQRWTPSAHWLAAGSALLLAACSSTPMPPWPSQAAPARPAPVVTPAPAPAPTVVVPSPAQPQAIAPRTELEALPYSAAVAARFPAPDIRYSTPGLNANPSRATSNAELHARLQSLSLDSLGQTSRLGLVQAGQSQSGTTIHAVVATKATGIDPASLDGSQRPTVLLVAGEQGNAPASTEALLVMAQELAPGGLLAPLLDRINVVLVPRANPDGAERRQAATADGTLLRRDHLLLSTPEAQALARLSRDYRPMAVLDLGEFDAIQPSLRQLNGLRSNDIGLQYALTVNSHEFITKAAREWYHQPLTQSLRQAGLQVDWHYRVDGDASEPSAQMGTVQPITLRNVSALKNAIGLLAESRGADLGSTHLQRRVHSLVTAATSVLQSTATHAADLAKVQGFVLRDTAALACRSQLTINAQPVREQREVRMLAPETGSDMNVAVRWLSGLGLQSAQQRPRPCGYWLSARAGAAAERLQLLGVQVQKVAETGPVLADSYQAKPGTGMDGADGLRLVQTTPTRSAIDATEGSYYISMNQPLAHLAAAALEPDTPFSYYAHRLLPELADVARVMSPPAVVFEEE